MDLTQIEKLTKLRRWPRNDEIATVRSEDGRFERVNISLARDCLEKRANLPKIVDHYCVGNTYLYNGKVFAVMKTELVWSAGMYIRAWLVSPDTNRYQVVQNISSIDPRVEEQELIFEKFFQLQL